MSDIKREVYNTLKDRLVPASSGWYKTRCPLCGDSHKDPNKKRFYIQFNFDNDEPIGYNCFNCNASGYVTATIMRAFNKSDLHINAGLINLNKEVIKKEKKFIKLLNKLDYKIPLYSNNDEGAYKKKRYVENRLGVSLSYEDIQALKGILNISRFLLDNNIEEITCDTNVAVAIERQYTGFLTSMNDCIVFRNIKDDRTYKHIKYNLQPKIPSYKFYTIPNRIDIITDETITINMAEGIYDILGVFFNVRNQEATNNIYASVASSNYTSVLEYYIRKGIVGDVIVNIYSDGDKSPTKYLRLYERVKPLIREFNVYYNSLSKDFGVPKHMISIYKANLKK